jgi:hypothetical protein
MTDDELKMIRERAERDVGDDSPPRHDHERLTRAVFTYGIGAGYSLRTHKTAHRREVSERC